MTKIDAWEAAQDMVLILAGVYWIPSKQLYKYGIHLSEFSGCRALSSVTQMPPFGYARKVELWFDYLVLHPKLHSTIL